MFPQEQPALLPSIHSPEDVRTLSSSQLNTLCRELRDTIVHTVAQTGGHLSSNLGIVEVTVALHRVFHTPHDQIVWDVGHQCYVHKLLTGRAPHFATLRKEGGISGFPRPCESEHDAFIAGHSSNAISVANGMAKAKALTGDDGYVVAVVGDGALTGGLAYEGLSNAGRSKDRLIVVLNDNGMSISQNVGFVARHLATLRAQPRYVRFKAAFGNALLRVPLIGKPVHKFLQWCKTRLKKSLYSRSSYFEEMGFHYIGPLDGHDVHELIRGFQSAKRLERPVLMHVATVKGKGCSFAEQQPDRYHGVPGYDEATGTLHCGGGTTFSQVFGETLCTLARQDDRLCAITAAMLSGTCLTAFAQEFPKRLFDVGIAEEHAVSFAAGLAHNGTLPVFAVYSTFLQRAYDQLIHDAAILNEHVVLAIDRAGIVGDDGETHQGIFDVAFLNTIPHATVWSPSTYEELRLSLHHALYAVPGLVAVRYPRGSEPSALADYRPDGAPFTLLARPLSSILLVTYGREFAAVYEAARQLEIEGLAVSVLKLTQIKPIDRAAVDAVLGYDKVFFFEEGIRDGGVGDRLGALLHEREFAGVYHVTAIDGFVPVCTPSSGLRAYGLDASHVLSTVQRLAEVYA